MGRKFIATRGADALPATAEPASRTWMLTLTASSRQTAAADLPGARAYRAYRASRAKALGLALAGTSAGEWSAWMRSAAKEWPGIASTSGICVALQRMSRFGRFGPPKGCWPRTQVGEFGVHHSIVRTRKVA